MGDGRSTVVRCIAPTPTIMERLVAAAAIVGVSSTNVVIVNLGCPEVQTSRLLPEIQVDLVDQ